MRGRTAVSLGVLLAVSVDVACGARTSLQVDGAGDSDMGGTLGVAGNSLAGIGGSLGKAGAATAGRGGGAGARDAGAPDASASGGARFDAGLDAALDAAVPSCGDGGKDEIFVLTTDNVLWAFDPMSSVFRFVGVVTCPSSGSPFSMGVGSDGFALSVFNNGDLMRIDTRTAACAGTSYVSGQAGFSVFGMGFAPNSATDPRERLYVAQQGSLESKGLGAIDPTSFAFTFIGPFSDATLPSIEFTSSADGRLFGYSLAVGVPSGLLLEIDKQNASILSKRELAIPTASAKAFAYFHGQFYFFTTEGDFQTTAVTRFDPQTGAVTNVAILLEVVVGAGLVCPTL
ncbi:MAG TPA: hypothetical protein VGI10_29840 [Polyangiaceae bacterium]|jgi:hypothetical protein